MKLNLLLKQEREASTGGWWEQLFNRGKYKNGKRK